MINYGFASLDDRAKPIELAPSEEPERFALQLYDHVAGAVNLRGLDVLDMSCGRGGGTSYIYRHLGAGHVTGVDSCRRFIAYCRTEHDDSHLTFVHGSADRLPFGDEEFDAVVNVESSFCYADPDKVWSEVRRVLKRGGFFAFADLRHRFERPALLESFKTSGLRVIEEADITPNVRRALELDNERRAELIRRRVPAPLRSIFRTYAGVEGSRIPSLLNTGEMIYLCCLLQKPGGAARPRIMSSKGREMEREPAAVS